jgi:hypothetical protein
LRPTFRENAVGKNEERPGPRLTSRKARVSRNDREVDPVCTPEMRPGKSSNPTVTAISEAGFSLIRSAGAGPRAGRSCRRSNDGMGENLVSALFGSMEQERRTSGQGGRSPKSWETAGARRRHFVVRGWAPLSRPTRPKSGFRAHELTTFEHKRNGSKEAEPRAHQAWNRMNSRLYDRTGPGSSEALWVQIPPSPPLLRPVSF